MATVGIINPSLADVLSRTDPNGNISTIIEVAEKSNPILQDGIYTECNDGSKHQTVIRTGIPEPAFRRYNQGVQPSKSTTVPVVDTTGMIEDYTEVDKALADLSGNASNFRASEAAAKMQGFNNFVAHNMFYGDTKVTPEGFMGLDARFNDANADSARQIVDAGGTGSDNGSIWFITWGPRGCQLLYPKGSAVGFQHNDKGETTKQEGSGSSRKLQEIYLDHMKWDIGLTVGDWRSCARVANIDISDLTADGATGAKLLDLMIKAYHKIDTATRVGIDMQTGELVQGKTCIYVPETVYTYLDLQATNKKNVQLKHVEAKDGTEEVTMFRGMPIRKVDALKETEAQITGL